jgi:DNA-binding transcriptional LysR family regulator
MDLRHLQHFIAVAETGKFTAAAQRMHIVQSGISVSIRELEEELGSKLIDRTTRKVSLTNAGRLFLEHARNSLAMLQEGVEAVRMQDGIVRGRLHVGILQSLGPYLDLPEVLKRFRAAYPLVEFGVRSLSTEKIPGLVRSGYVDLSFHALVSEDKWPGLEVIPYAQDELVAICSRTLGLSQKKKVRIDQLTENSFVDLSPERALRKLVDRIFLNSRLERSTVYEVSDVENLLHFVSRGLGVAIVPSELARSAAERGKLAILRLKEEDLQLPRWRIVILTRKRSPGVRGKTTVELFLDTLGHVRANFRTR